MIVDTVAPASGRSATGSAATTFSPDDVPAELP